MRRALVVAGIVCAATYVGVANADSVVLTPTDMDNITAGMPDPPPGWINQALKSTDPAVRRQAKLIQAAIAARPVWRPTLTAPGAPPPPPPPPPTFVRR